MAFGVGEQLESSRTWLQALRDSDHPWRIWNRWRRPYKQSKARRERRRARQDPECLPEYRRFDGYEL